MPKDEEALAMWTVYDHPHDYPNSFIARMWLATVNGLFATQRTIVAPTLEEVRKQLPPGLTRMDPDPNDDPCIAEVWL